MEKPGSGVHYRTDPEVWRDTVLYPRPGWVSYRGGTEYRSGVWVMVGSEEHSCWPVRAVTDIARKRVAAFRDRLNRSLKSWVRPSCRVGERRARTSRILLRGTRRLGRRGGSCRGRALASLRF